MRRAISIQHNLHGFVLSLILLFSTANLSAVETGFYINETFRGTSTNVVTFGGNPKKAYLTSTVIDPEGDGWLRLTSDEQEQKGYAIMNQPFASSNGVLIDMEFMIWRSHSDGFGGADGFSIFLYDATVSPFAMGGFGGSLGYAQRTVNGVAEPGLSGGYVGIGFDEYGNFSNFSEERDGGIGFGRTPNTIGIRGPGIKADNWFHGYNWMAGNTNLGFSLQAGEKPSRPLESAHYRRVQVEITPIASGFFTITVRMMTQKNGTFATVLGPYTLPEVPPSLLKLGLAASTGQSINSHEIRNLVITSSGGIRTLKSVDKTYAKVGDQLTYSIDVYNQTDQKATGLILRDTLSKITPNFKVTSVTFDNHGDASTTASNYSTTDLSNVTMDVAPISRGTLIIQGNVTGYPEGGVLTNYATVDLASSGIVDKDMVNNTSFASTIIELANAPDFIIAQSANSVCIAPANTNTLALTVSNKGKSASTLGSVVTVKDTIPSGLRVVGTPGGTGWTTTHVGNAYAFTRSDILAKSSNFPDISFVVEQIGSTPNLSWVNTASVTNENDLANSNNKSTPLTLYSPANVDAGLDQTVYSSGVVTLAGSSPGAWNGVWSVASGSANISNLNLPNSTVTLQPNTTATLRWTLSNGDCSYFDEVNIAYYLPKVTLLKEVSNPQTFKLGSKIDYSFTITNAGLATLSNVVLTDALLPSAPVYLSGDLNLNSKLDIGESWIYTGSYTVKQSDVDTGSFKNTASITCNDPLGNPVSDVSGTATNNDTETTTPIEHLNKVTLLKNLSNIGPFKLGDEIQYSFEVSNSGTTTLSAVNLVDNKLPVSPVYKDGDNNSNSKLDVGEVWTYTGTYRVKQTDVNFGKVSNIATVYTKDNNGVEVSDVSGNNVPTVAYLGEGKITLVKEVDTLITKAPFVLNDSIIYKFTLNNIGEVPLSTVVLTDLKFALSSPPVYKSGDVNKNNILDKTETWIYRGKYYISQADVDVGKVINSALVTSKYDNGFEIKAASDSSGTKPITDDPTITPIVNLAKVALVKNITNGPKFKIGQDINYLFTVKNLGTVTLRNVIITDPKIDDTPLYLSGDNNSNSILDPKESWSFSAHHTVTQADVIAGVYNNSAIVNTKDGRGNTVSDISGTFDTNDLPTPATIDQGPIANDDAAQTTQVSPVTIDVHFNDTQGGSPIDVTTIEITAQPLNGIVTIVQGGQIVYTPVKGFTGDDTFNYRVKDDKGNWSNIAVVTVTVAPNRLVIPNAFSPNGDGINDQFVIGGLANFDDAKLIVYNRWGNEVYKSETYRNDWNGYGLNNGTYYYLLNLTTGGKSYQHKGWILIER
ncbi:MAG: DUF7507 domain-containing protein [Bacteroidales bacterium]